MEQRRERILEAQRAGLRNRIRDQWHVSEGRADALLEAWATEATERGLKPGETGYWTAGEAWVRERLDVSAPGLAQAAAGLSKDPTTVVDG
jgi:hypothetical protein